MRHKLYAGVIAVAMVGGLSVAVAQTGSGSGSGSMSSGGSSGGSASSSAQGSITLDGVSLTVNEVRDADDGNTQFAVNIIPHTAQHTTLGKLEQGQQLNVEVDVLARYIDRMLAARSQ